MDPLQAQANFNRICQLLIDKGSDALRHALHVVHPASTLAAALHSHRKTLQKLRYNVINPSQWRLLYPSAGTPNSNDFDITLLTILLRNICGLSSPTTGWNAMPLTADTSISADILRIKIFRNEVYGHRVSAQYDDSTFEKLWQEISQPLVKLGIPQQEIDELKVAPLSPEEKSYVETLMEWKEQEDTLLEKMKDFENQMVDMRADVKKLKDTLGTSNVSNVDQLTKFDFKVKVDGLCKKFQEGTRQWFFDELSTWFADEESRVMILTAGPGIGKSVLSAKVCQDYSERGKLAGRHFCDFRKSNYSKPLNILQSVASQMCDNVDGFREKLTEILGRNHSRDSLSDAFTVFLNEPLHALDRREPMLIVVDALEESKTDGKSEFLELISDEFPDLPKWIKILITSRPELQVKKKLEHFNPLEILPQDDNQQKDIKCFVKGSFPHFKVNSVDYLVSKCEGSFLYAYHMIKELKEMDAGVEPNLSDYTLKGISGFYEQQFKRLRTGLQQHDPGFLSAFVNVVAASSGAPLLITILLKCMNLSNEKYEIRNTIFNIVSEILPVYNNCITVYHKSLMDWLTLEGYEEHAFVADVDDGTKRLWEVCEGIYRVIDSTFKSVSEFKLSLESEFALTTGGEFLLKVGDTADFRWLVNIRLNALKFRFCGGLNVDYCRILNNYKSSLSEDLYWSIVQHYSISDMIATCDVGMDDNSKKIMYCMYLQSLANTHFDLTKRCTGFQNTARDILNKTNPIWLEEVVNTRNSDYEIISYAVFPKDVFSGRSSCFVSSPDKKLLVCVHGKIAKIFKLPSLTMIFELKLSRAIEYPQALTFSPDSTYFLYDSIRSCVCIRKQKEVKFISGGPEFVHSCSFSLCGMKLVTSENRFVKVWDVEKRNLLVELQTPSPIERCLFSTCNVYILGLEKHSPGFCIWHATTWQKLDIKICVDSCLTCKGSFQIITIPSNINDRDTSLFYHFHLPTDEIVVVAGGGLYKDSFTWKSRNCVFIPISSNGLLMFDVIKQDVIDRFKIDCLPCHTHIDCISKLNEANFAFCNRLSHIFVLSLRTPEESPVVSYVNSVLKCVTVSPDQSYIACCYENCVLTIKNIDNGETMQTVELQHPPEACWWSELYLWVVCKGVIVKFPYDSGHPKGLGSCINECTLNFHRILQFENDVLVIEAEKRILIVKICENELISQQIADSIFGFFSAVISQDGCAVLLYRDNSKYQLWEFARENGWELRLSERFSNLTAIQIRWLSLTGRRWMCLTCDDIGGTRSDLSLYIFDFSKGSLRKCLLNSPIYIRLITEVYYVAPNFLLICAYKWVHVYNVLDGNIITVLYVGRVYEKFFRCYLSNKDLLLFVLTNDIKCFRINNRENCLES